MEYGLSSLKLGLVVEGISDCYICFGDIGEWDIVVLEVLFSEIGGEIFDLYFELFSYNECEMLINFYFIMVRDS